MPLKPEACQRFGLARECCPGTIFPGISEHDCLAVWLASLPGCTTRFLDLSGGIASLNHRLIAEKPPVSTTETQL